MKLNQLSTPLILLGVSSILSWILVLVIRLVPRDLLFVFFFPIDIPINSPYHYIGAVIALFGLLLVIWANYILLAVAKIGLENREPYHIPSTLALTGPYQISRNPIYLGVLLVLFGFAIVVRSFTVFVLGFLVFLLFRYKFIAWEEKALGTEFGEAYIQFTKRVRRWI